MIFRRLALALKALRQMGVQPLECYARYQLGLRTGYYRIRTAPRQLPASGSVATQPVFPLPPREALVAVLGDGITDLFAEADEIVAGKMLWFGMDWAPLILEVPGPLKHWTFYAKRLESAGRGKAARTLLDAGEWAPPEAAGDIKFLWEPGRFGWAYTLGRAFYLSGDERYAQAFWRYSETFLHANPVHLGPHWISAQEIALRLIALVFAAQAFAHSAHTTAQRAAWLAQAVANHAWRIPLTLAYARSQNNNHLLTEAAGLYTAGVFLPAHPHSARWRSLGWRWMHRGLQSQIAEDGAYAQNSANYHRLMLQAALWVYRLALAQGQSFPQNSMQRLATATRWLLALVDRQTGQAPNLGPNDGAYIFPFTVCPFFDYRPVLQTASQVFLGERPFPAGLWDEMPLWLGAVRQNEPEGQTAVEQSNSAIAAALQPSLYKTPHILRSPGGYSWAYLRIARHESRPGHADQLHLDLWWRGLNIAQDAGSYLYNALPPWENALASSFVHNTATVDGQEQMQRVGRFLWLDWAQAQAISGEPLSEEAWKSLLAWHNGYRRLGIAHQRRVIVFPDERWSVIDTLERTPKARKGARFNAQVTVRVHWLLPDWPWEARQDRDAGAEIHLQSPYGPILLRILALPGVHVANKAPASASQLLPLAVQMTRAGKLLAGAGPVSPTWGWHSPSYGKKTPALSIAATTEASIPLTCISEWIFPA